MLSGVFSVLSALPLLILSFNLRAQYPEYKFYYVPCSAYRCSSEKGLVKENFLFAGQAIVYQTSNKPEYMIRYNVDFAPQNNRGWQQIRVYQNQYTDAPPIIGFGGSFSDTTAILFKNMSPKLQQLFLKSYFSRDGLEYNLGRVPIASTDFSCRGLPLPNGKPNPTYHDCSVEHSQYSYADLPDKVLKHFALQVEDTEYKIPLIYAANRVRASEKQAPLKLFASPWSAPAWMKTNGSMVHGGLSPEYQQIWADYIIKFLEAYKNRKLLFWGLTVQNEPVETTFTCLQNWQTMFMTKDQEASFIKYFLGPTLTQYKPRYGSHINLIMHDDQVATILDRSSMLDDPEIAQYVNGLGLHWYKNRNLLYPRLDKTFSYINKDHPAQTRFILATEACQGYLPFDKGPKVGSWGRGESYAHDIMSDLIHHVSGWTDWNLVLDMQGGPNWAGNLVDAPVLVDLSKQVFYKQPMYYFMGHFSKFIRPGSRLINSVSSGFLPLEEVTYRVPGHDGIPETVVVTVLNRDNSSRTYYIEDREMKSDNRFLNITIPAHAIQTIIYPVGG